LTPAEIPAGKLAFIKPYLFNAKRLTSPGSSGDEQMKSHCAGDWQSNHGPTDLIASKRNCDLLPPERVS
jgi:hypothetical protein